MTQNYPAEYTLTLDDDPIVHKIIERATGLKSIPFKSGQDLLNNNPSSYKPAGVFIDIHLSDSESGLQLIPKLREEWPFCPFIIITSDPTEGAVTDALTCGADDFVTKPLRPKELLARFQARLADQAAKQSRQSFQFGEFTFDCGHRMLSGNQGTRYLSNTETNLLLCLLQAKGTIVSRETLKMKCWGGLKVSDGALDRKIYEVRKALQEIGGDASSIRTSYGVGFGLEIRQAG